MMRVDPVLNVLHLIERSKDIGEGWRKVSDHLWIWASEKCEHWPELIEINWEAHTLRLTPEALIVLKWTKKVL